MKITLQAARGGLSQHSKESGRFLWALLSPHGGGHTSADDERCEEGTARRRWWSTMLPHAVGPPAVGYRAPLRFTCT